MMRMLLFLAVVVAAGVFVFALLRKRRALVSHKRRAAWHAKRAEEDRIWYEKMGDDSPGG